VEAPWIHIHAYGGNRDLLSVRLLLFEAELAAGGVDVVAIFEAEGGRDAGILEDGVEGAAVVLAGAAPSESLDLVGGDPWDSVGVGQGAWIVDSITLAGRGRVGTSEGNTFDPFGGAREDRQGAMLSLRQGVRRW
jgi:hypothetical protein